MRWGDLESEEEESEEEEEEEEEDEEDTESLADGITSIASGYNSSLPSGIETPEVIDLRKGKPGACTPPPLVSFSCELDWQPPASCHCCGTGRVGTQRVIDAGHARTCTGIGHE